MDAIRATWPPSRLDRVGPFDLPAEREGTRRGTAARPIPGAAITDADVAAVETARPGTVFAAIMEEDGALEGVLAARGYAPSDPSDLMAGPISDTLPDTPPVSGFPHWPPMAICDALWDEHGNGPDRRTPMHRAPEPKTAILLRFDDRAAGALFVGQSGTVAVCHLVLTLPRARGKGVGRIGMLHAMRWAREHGADTMALPVEANNVPAVALYRRAGLVRRGGYRYWSRT
ncbi:GNAT family N-acetyltransferase [Jannaschia sp. KMU-145]|uniref:GNAT family N-acetyltransferase n=1 Tax=Jannaschia halovivens TaxID=3388667 RepID=UPI00396AFFB3